MIVPEAGTKVEHFCAVFSSNKNFFTKISHRITIKLTRIVLNFLQTQVMEAARHLQDLTSPPVDGLIHEVTAPANDPHPDGLADVNTNFVLAHGAVEVPGAPAPVKYTVSAPENLASTVMHVIVPGFGGVKRSSRGLRNALAEQENLLSLSFDPARGGGWLQDVLDAQRVHADTLGAILQDLPDNKELKDIPNADKIDFGQAVLLPHSMGSLAATEHARLHPNEAKAVTYMGSIGLEGSVGLDFIPRLAKSTSHDVAGKYVQGKLVPGGHRLHLAYRTAQYYLLNPRRTLGEIADCLTADIQKPVRLLDVLGVKTAALYFGADRLVPVTPHSIHKAKQMVDLCEVMQGYGHLAPQRHPYEVAARLGSISARLESLDTA